MSDVREKGAFPSTSVMGADYSRVCLERAVERLARWAEEEGGRRTRIVVATGFHGLWIASQDPAYRELLNKADMLCADGVAPVILSKLRGASLPGRVPGPDLFERFMEYGADRELSSFFFGDTERTLELLRATVRERFPGHRIAGTLSPPFCPSTPEEESDMVARINQAAPDVLWVALGTPKQERWLFRHRESLRVPAAVGVGAAFRFLTGQTRRAPDWVGAAGFEWAWRLAMEPRKLWRRSLVDAPRFAARALRWVVANDTDSAERDPHREHSEEKG